jgi:hypothetical protein
LICRTRYALEEPSFRWNDLSKEEKKEVASVVEHIVLQTISINNCLPLNLAVDSWAVCHLLSVAICNEGKRKEGLAKTVSVFFS